VGDDGAEVTPAELQRICHDALACANVKAFLRVIRSGETSQGDEAYRTIVGGGRFEKFDDHPRQLITVQPGLKSTAAGAYQFLSRTWDECAVALELPDFSPLMQDLAAVYLIRRRGALDDVIAGRFEAAVMKCNREWASLPGSPYGQPTKSMAQAIATYKQFGGSFDTSPQPVQKPAETEHIKERIMPLPAILAAVLPSIIEAIPRLGKLFGSGSEVAERNVKAAELAVEIVKDATGAVNAQEAAEKIKADPAAAAVAARAIEQRWVELYEAGGGGIDGARKADAAVMLADGPWWLFLRSPSFWALLLLLPLVYLLVGSLVGLWGTATWSDDVRSGLAGSIISAVIGGAVGYYWGQTTSRNRS